MSLRPVLYAIDQDNVAGCGAQSCVKAVMLVGTPAMWFIAVPVLGWAVWRAFVKRDWRYAVVLTGYCAGFLPWFADIDRQMYFFYAATMAPFLVMVIALILGDILYAPEAERRATNARAARGVLLRRGGHHELRLDVPDSDRPADLAVDVEHADLAAHLALAPPVIPRGATPDAVVVCEFIHSAWTSISSKLGGSCRSPTPTHPRHGTSIRRQRSDLRVGASDAGANLRWSYDADLSATSTLPQRQPLTSIDANAHAAWLWSEPHAASSPAARPRRCTV